MSIICVLGPHFFCVAPGPRHVRAGPGWNNWLIPGLQKEGESLAL